MKPEISRRNTRHSRRSARLHEQSQSGVLLFLVAALFWLGASFPWPVNAQTSGQPKIDIDQDCSTFAFSPDNHIAYGVRRVFNYKKYTLEGDDLWVATPDGKRKKIVDGERIVKVPDKPGSYAIHDIWWSPDSRKLVVFETTERITDAKGTINAGQMLQLLDVDGHEIDPRGPAPVAPPTPPVAPPAPAPAPVAPETKPNPPAANPSDSNAPPSLKDKTKGASSTSSSSSDDDSSDDNGGKKGKGGKNAKGNAPSAAPAAPERDNPLIGSVAGTWLPDGATVVYLTVVIKPHELFEMHKLTPATGKTTRIFPEHQFVDVIWEVPQGTAIAAERDRELSGPAMLVSLDLVHETRTEIAPIPSFQGYLSVSRSRRRVAYFSDGDTLQVVDLASPAKPKTIRAAYGRFEWGQDDNHILLKPGPETRSGTLSWVDISANDFEPAMHDLIYRDFHISPDGRWVGLLNVGKQALLVYPFVSVIQ